MTKDNHLYRRLLGYVLPYWQVFLLSVLSMVVLALTEPAIAALMQPLFDGAFISQDKDMEWLTPVFGEFFSIAREDIVVTIPLLLVGLFTIRGVAYYINGVSLNWVAQQAIMVLRQQMFARLLNFPASYFDRTSSGKIVSRFIFDVTQIKEATTTAITTLIRDSLTVIGLLAWMFYVNKTLTFICLLAAPFIALVILFIKHHLRRLSRKVQDAVGDIHHLLNEGIDAQKLVKLYEGKAAEIGRFGEVVHHYRGLMMKFVLAATASSPAVQIITAFVLATVIYIAAQQASDGALTVGNFISFFTAMALLLAPIKRIASVNEPIQKGLAACESVFALLDHEQEIDNGSRTLYPVQKMIVFDKVSYRYGPEEEPVLDAVSLQIEAGKMVALVGRSGSGKTTLVNLLPRFYEPVTGQIMLDGVDIREISLASLRKNIAYVSQDVILFNDTVRNNIAYAQMSQYDDAAVWQVAEAACASEFIRRLPDGMDTIIGAHGIRLSGGQRQRLAIARALLKDAPILLLDEATSSLDSRSEQDIQRALEKIKGRRTCIIIAHRLSTIEAADQIVVIDAGRIKESGTHRDLLAKDGLYARLYQTQFRIQT